MAWFRGPNAARGGRLTWVDGLLLLVVAAFLVVLMSLGHGMVAPLRQSMHPISLSPWSLPYDAARSLLRIVVALVFSLLFAVAYGYAAAKVPIAEKVLVPLLDILQSVPVLGFLAVTVTAFVGLFPHSLFGLELASIFAIFTAQAWNMTFAFYHSLKTLPGDLTEAVSILRLSPWQRLMHLELPASAISLTFNAMMSVGGSWFFLTASESFTIGNQPVHLPGIGSYIFEAQSRGDWMALVAAIAVMIVLIVAIDQLFWRPMLAWTQKFKMELTQESEQVGSFFLTFLRRSQLVQLVQETVLAPFGEWLDRAFQRPTKRRTPGLPWLHVALYAVLAAGCALVVVGLARGAVLVAALGAPLLLRVVEDGMLTLWRVLASVLLGALWTIPAGVAIGLSPRFSRVAQPAAQILASFPANVLFPMAIALLARFGIGINWGAIPLMTLGTQWYLLFNVMAGASSIPADLKQAAKIFGLDRTLQWRELILPAIFPSLVTGGVTAAGGAWNASIVAEMVTWRGHQYAASGLGALITLAAARGQMTLLLLGILVMSVLVVTTNRLVWRPLYHLAETKYHLE